MLRHQHLVSQIESKQAIEIYYCYNTISMIFPRNTNEDRLVCSILRTQIKQLNLKIKFSMEIQQEYPAFQ